MANGPDSEKDPVFPHIIITTIKLSGTHSKGVGQLIAQLRCKIHQQMFRCSQNLGGISKSEKVNFQMVTERNNAIAALTCSRSEFQRVGNATEKARVSA